MEKMRTELYLPEEPTGLRVETRRILEDSPEVGTRLIRDAAFVAETLWDEWGDDLREAGMNYGQFLTIARGYSSELRLWVVGERPWEHCVSGLAGRVTRRLPAAVTEQRKAVLCSEGCR